jgi:hypothetical protein
MIYSLIASGTSNNGHEQSGGGDYGPPGANQLDLLADCCQLVGFFV